MFGKIDAKGTGELTEKQLEAGIKKNTKSEDLSSLGGNNLSSTTLSALLQILSGQNQSADASSTSADGGGNDQIANQIFNQIDTNKDGKVNKNEFVSNRPEFISEAQASETFDNIDKEGTGSITKEQFAQNAPKPPASGDAGADKLSDSSGDLVNQLLEAIASYSKNLYSSADTKGDASSLLAA